MSFVHLHCHSEYSLLDGANRIDSLIRRAQELEMPALAVTDHGNMHAAWEFQEHAKKAKIKPILGMEAYVAPGSRLDRGRPSPGAKPYHHLVLLARDAVGYKNLVKLSSLAYLEGFYVKPRVDRELLAAHSEGIIVSSACLAGEVAGHLMDDRWDAAREAAEWYANVFKDRYYLEVQAHDSEGQSRLNERIFALGADLGLPVIATNDAHFLKETDHDAHDVLLCIGIGKDVKDQNRMHYDRGLYFKSHPEMAARFADRADVLENTLRIADEVDVQFGKKYHVPSFPLPAGVETENDLLVKLATEGAHARYGAVLSDEVEQRLKYELGVILQTGYAGYFLITADFIQAARDRGIPVGPGRGSAAGSIVAYALGITNVCPLKFDLLFERFLNPERVSMPDVDVDFCFERRGEVIEYVRQKYGKESVCQIVTFGTMKSRAAVKDVGRVLGFTPAETDALAKLIPNAPNYSLTVAEAIEQVPDVVRAYKEDPRYRELLDYAVALEGLSRHTGVHAAGVVIAPGPVHEFVPVCTQASKGAGGGDGDEKVTVAQYDMTALEKAGMLKMDFLGLTTLTVIHDALVSIERRTGQRLDLDGMPAFDDAKTYQMLRSGRTAGVFQFESPLATDVLRQMRCDRFDDLVASNALLRPGPLDTGMHKVYIRRKRGEEPVAYALPELEPILRETQGVITYQEQVMRIAQTLAGISLAEADVLRKAVGKKDAELIRAELGKFTEKAIAKGHGRGVIEELAGQIETFGRYGFNKCLVADSEILDVETGSLTRIGDLYERRATVGAVASCDERTLRLAPGRVLDVVDNGVRPVFRLRTQTGREIVATANHPLLTFGGWRQLGELAEGDQIAVPRALHVEGSAVWPDYAVVALGHLLAEGNLCHPNGLYFYNQDEAALDDFTAAAEHFANVRCTRSTHKNTGYIYTGRVDRKRPNGIFEWARGLGLLGRTARDKEVPAEAFTLKREQLALLLARMWEGDGHVNVRGRSAYYATASKRLAHQVSHLLLRLGVIARLREVEFPYKDGRIGYQVFVTGRDNLRAFAETVGARMLVGAKRDAMWALATERVSVGACKDVIPTAVHARVDGLRARAGMTWANVAVATGLDAATFSARSVAAHRGGFTRETVGRLANYFEDPTLRDLAEGDVLWDRVASIEPAGEARTFDLEIEGTHNFVANDIIVHNSHSVAYSVLSYQTAYLKANYPADFMAALLSSCIGDTDSVVKYVAEAREMQLDVLPPDVNESGYKFTVIADNRIRFGLGAVRNVGEGAVDSVLGARAKEGSYTDFFDFVERVDLRACNKRVFEALIHAGALDTVGGHRAQYLAALDHAIQEASLKQQEAATGQGSLFGLLGGDAATAKPAARPTLPHLPPWSESDRLAAEKAILGFYVSGHPLEPFRAEAELFGTHKVAELGAWTPNKIVLACVITACKRQISKRSGSEFARLILEDFSGATEVLVFPEAWSVLADQVKTDVPVLVEGGYSRRDQDAETPTFIVEKVTKLAEKRLDGAVAVAIELAAGADLTPSVMADVRATCDHYPGTAALELRWRDGKAGGSARFRSRSLTVAASNAALGELRALLGDERVKLVRGS